MKNSKFYRSTSILFMIILAFSCTSQNSRIINGNIRFALFGSTFPESPYAVMGDKIEPSILKINYDNPLFAVHTGDFVCGGKKWTGIKKSDIEKQYNHFFSMAGKLKPILYPVIGEADFFNKSSDIYSTFTKRIAYYSFNYGHIHFIILNTADALPGEIGAGQIEWLKKDLEIYKSSEAIFIFSHHPFFFPKGEMTDQDEIVKDKAALHKLFVKYPVKAVFSGHYQIFHREDIDNIIYVTAGCGNYDRLSGYSSRIYQYYIVDYSNGVVNINPKRI